MKTNTKQMTPHTKQVLWTIIKTILSLGLTHLYDLIFKSKSNEEDTTFDKEDTTPPTETTDTDS